MAINIESDSFLRNDSDDCLLIRGQLLPVASLLSAKIDDPDFIQSQAAAYRSARPFAHIVMEELFHPDLLRLIEEEFEEQREGMRRVKGKRESTTRLPLGAELGTAAQAYVNLVHSHRFVRFVSQVTGIDDLIVDHSLRGGGLHETHNGGHFDIHRDFNFHHENMLANRMVLITYLNRDWLPEYGGDLELWNARTRQCEKAVAPLFGHTLLMAHSKASFHGHPHPMNAPEGRTRKSIAAYYYENEMAQYQRRNFRSSLFISEIEGEVLPAGKGEPVRRQSTRKQVKRMLRDVTPPVVWLGARRLRAYRRKRKS